MWLARTAVIMPGSRGLNLLARRPWLGFQVMLWGAGWLRRAEALKWAPGESARIAGTRKCWSFSPSTGICSGWRASRMKVCVLSLSLTHARTHTHTHTRAHRTHASTGPLVVTLFFVKLFFVTPFVTLFAELALSIWYRVLSFLRTLPCPLSFLSIFSLALFL